MTKEITKSIILQEIQDKLKLREFEPDNFLFSETVIPTYNIEQHLLHWEVLVETVSITSATNFLFFTVPDNERWTLRAYSLYYGMTGAIKGTGLYMINRPGGNTTSFFLDLKKNQEVSYLVNLPFPVVIDAGTELRYLIDTYVTTQDLTVRCDVMREEIR